MRAVARKVYGSPDVLALTEVERPEPGDDEVLVEVRAVSLNASDVEALSGSPLYLRLVGVGFRKPKLAILGSDVAGRVTAVGAKVTRFRPGDEVLADTLYHGQGGLAEYVAIPESAPMVRKPARLTFAEAAAIPQAGVIALQGIRDKGRVQAGQRVLINGAGGSAGSFAVQLARSAGAEVTAVDRGAKRDMLLALGADRFVDYTREDPIATEHVPAGGYDFVLDMAAHRSLLDYRRVLAPHGVYALVGGSTGAILSAALLGVVTAKSGGRKLGILAVRPNDEDLAAVAELVATGELRPVIDRCYPLDEGAAALRRLAAGEALGKVVVTL